MLETWFIIPLAHLFLLMELLLILPDSLWELELPLQNSAVFQLMCLLLIPFQLLSSKEAKENSIDIAIMKFP